MGWMGQATNGGAAGYFAGAVPAVERDLRPTCTITIDTEEDFDWSDPTEGTDQSTAHLHRIGTLQNIFAAYGAIPAYLVTYPVLNDPDAVRTLRREHERGRCSLGLQLHPWVTPPLLHRRDAKESFAGYLEANFEERKLRTLATRFNEAFGCAPRTYRAGRYGFGPHSAALLEELGIEVDTSVAPRTDFSEEGGPDYTGFDFTPFWFGQSRRLLGLPLCRSTFGLGGAAAPGLYRLAGGGREGWSLAAGVVTWLRLAERVTLSPEGNDINAMMRLVRALLARGQHVFPISFHSSSIAPGRNPYVRSARDMHVFYDRLSALLSFMADTVGAEFIALEDVPARYAPPAMAGA